MSEDPTTRGYNFDEVTRALASGSINRRRALKLFAAGLVGSVIPARVASASGKKVTICHRTSSEKNPWVEISVSVNAWPAHQEHGDFIVTDKYPCPPKTTTTTKKPTTTTTKKPTTTTTKKPTTTTTKKPTTTTTTTTKKY